MATGSFAGPGATGARAPDAGAPDAEGADPALPDFEAAGADAFVGTARALIAGLVVAPSTTRAIES